MPARRLSSRGDRAGEARRSASQASSNTGLISAATSASAARPALGPRRRGAEAPGDAVWAGSKTERRASQPARGAAATGTTSASHTIETRRGPGDSIAPTTAAPTAPATPGTTIVGASTAPASPPA